MQQKSKLGILITYSIMYIFRSTLNQLSDQIVYSYKTLPSYSKISLFSAASYPFSFKFIISPFQETYTFQSYGRKKTWIVSCGILGSIFLFIMSFFTGQSQQTQLAVLLLFCLFFICSMGTQNDSMLLKQIKSAEDIGLSQSISSVIGQFLGSFVFIWLISSQFAALFGKSTRVITVQMYFLFFSGLGFILFIYFHFAYKQLRLQSEEELRQKNLFSIVYNFKVFFDLEDKYCRTGLLFLIYSLGYQFFEAGLIPQAIKRGFRKQTETTITNICILPTLLLIYLFNRYVGKPQWRYYYIYACIVLKLIFYIIMYIINSVSLPAMIITIGGKHILDNFLFLAECQIMASFPVTALGGMYMTALYSLRNLGLNLSLFFLIIQKMGYRNACILGFSIQGALCIGLPFMILWIEKGKTIEEDPVVAQHEQLNQQNHESPAIQNPAVQNQVIQQNTPNETIKVN